MILAAVGDTPYNIMLLLHLLTAFAAFAPVFVHPLLYASARSGSSEARTATLTRLAKNGRMIHAPALVLTGVFGFGLAGMSDDVFKLSQGWLIAAVIAWIAMNGILHAVLLPAERAVAGGDDSAQSRLDLGSGAYALLLVVMLYLMVWKPGL